MADENGKLYRKSRECKPRIYSQEPRTEVYCFKLNFNISKLVYLGFINCKYIQWAPLYAEKHVVTVKPCHSAVFLTKIQRSL